MSPVHNLRPAPATTEEWAARLGSHDVTADDRVAFTEWLKADPSRRVDYERVSVIESLPMALENHEYVAHLLAEVDEQALPPGVHSVPAVRPWYMPASLAAAIALLSVSVVIALPILKTDLQRVATRHGEQRVLTLPDGSVIQLNTDTQLAYRVDNDERHVKLTMGEAFFDVAKDSARPFIVATQAAEIHVIGTQFSVRTHAEGIDVIVKEGKVNIVRPDNSLIPVRLLSLTPEDRIELIPGNHLRIAAAAKAPQIVSVDANRATAWRSGILDIDAMTLEDVVAEVNRYVPAPFVIEDDSIRHLQLSGRFRLGDTEGLRFMLRERLNVESTPRGEIIALRSAR